MDYLQWGLLAGALTSGGFWAYDRWVFSKRREIFGKVPWGIRALAPWFPTLAALAVCKAFVAEPFQIPSVSMRPTLSPGSVVVATKWNYNVRLPDWAGGSRPTVEPRRGDVVLFAYPVDDKSVFVKRVVGLPGDTVRLEPDGSLKINGKSVERRLENRCDTSGELSERGACHERWVESWEGRSWAIWGESRGKALKTDPEPEPKACRREPRGALSCQVPEDSYFMLGDNRGDSMDSRYWGSVRRERLIGKAVVDFSFSGWATSGAVR
jgi:signal peptidase I